MGGSQRIDFFNASTSHYACLCAMLCYHSENLGMHSWCASNKVDSVPIVVLVPNCTILKSGSSLLMDHPHSTTASRAHIITASLCKLIESTIRHALSLLFLSSLFLIAHRISFIEAQMIVIFLNSAFLYLSLIFITTSFSILSSSFLYSIAH